MMMQLFVFWTMQFKFNCTWIWKLVSWKLIKPKQETITLNISLWVICFVGASESDELQCKIYKRRQILQCYSFKLIYLKVSVCAPINKLTIFYFLCRTFLFFWLPHPCIYTKLAHERAVKYLLYFFFNDYLHV